MGFAFSLFRYLQNCHATCAANIKPATGGTKPMSRDLWLRQRNCGFVGFSVENKHLIAF